MAKRVAGKPFVFVLNECEPRMREVAIAREAVAQLGDVLEVGKPPARLKPVAAIRSGERGVRSDCDAVKEISRAWAEVAEKFDVWPGTRFEPCQWRRLQDFALDTSRSVQAVVVDAIPDHMARGVDLDD